MNHSLSANQSQVTAMVLAGGRGTRMGGLNKGLQYFGQSRLIEHVTHRLAPQVSQVVINANEDCDQYAGLGYEIWQDEGPRCGPLSGFLTGLQRCLTPFLMIAPCDTPLLPLDIVSRLLLDITAKGNTVCIAESQNSNDPSASQPTYAGQPTFCLIWMDRLRAEQGIRGLEDYIAFGGRRVYQWIKLHKFSSVRFNSPPYSPLSFANLNTLEALRALEGSLNSNADNALSGNRPSALD